MGKNAKYYKKCKDDGLCPQCYQQNPSGKTYCNSCSEKMVARNKVQYKKRKEAGLCPRCGSKERIEDDRSYCLTCAKRRRESRNRLKQETFAEYGGKCSCCGERQLDFLTIDHVFEDGAEHRRKISKNADGRGGGGDRMYQQLRKEGYPKDRYQLLCFNCNSGRQINGGVCPHKDSDPSLVLASAGII